MINIFFNKATRIGLSINKGRKVCKLTTADTALSYGKEIQWASPYGTWKSEIRENSIFVTSQLTKVLDFYQNVVIRPAVLLPLLQK